MESENFPLDDSERFTVEKMQRILEGYVSEASKADRVPDWVWFISSYVNEWNYRLRDFWQRGKRGYSNIDCIDATEHLLLVIAGMVRHIRLYGEPTFPEELDEEDNPAEGLFTWYSILEEIERSCYRYGQCLAHPDLLSLEEMDWAEKQCDQAMRLFATWYTYLHE